MSSSADPVTGGFKSPLLPHPTPGKGGKGGDTPHPAKGLQPLGSLLCLLNPWGQKSRSTEREQPL